MGDKYFLITIFRQLMQIFHHHLYAYDTPFLFQCSLLACNALL